MQCLINEHNYNHFYTLLAQYLTNKNQQFKFSLQYTLWDYLKSINKLEIAQINNLSRMFGYLIAHNNIPLAFIKGLDLQKELEKSEKLFLFLLLDRIIDECKDKAQIKKVFERGHKEEGFLKGLS